MFPKRCVLRKKHPIQMTIRRANGVPGMPAEKRTAEEEK
jgi:hypothetical protein